MKVVTFYHIGCPVSEEAERSFLKALDGRQYSVEKVNLGQEKARAWEAKDAGVKSVPAVVINGKAFHINYSISIDELCDRRYLAIAL
jgi:glutaredoxin